MFDSNATQRQKQHFVSVYFNISINSLQFVSTEIHQLKILLFGYSKIYEWYMK